MAERTMAGSGRTLVAWPAAKLRSALLDPAVLACIIPGAERVESLDATHYRAVLSFGVGPLRSYYAAELRITGQAGAQSLVLEGKSAGRLGGGRATGHVLLLEDAAGGTIVDWRYDGAVSGPVTLAGDTLLRRAADSFVHRFFNAVARLPQAVRLGPGRT